MTGWPKSLGGRLLISASVLIVVALLVTGIAMEVALRRFIQGQVDGRLDGQILSVRDALRAGADGSLSLERTVDGPPFERPLSGWYWEVLTPEPVLRSRSLLGSTMVLAGPLPDGPLPDGPLPDSPLPEHHPRPVAVDGRGPPDEALRVRVQRFNLGSRVVTIASAAPLKALSGPLHEALMPVGITLALLALGLIGAVRLQVGLGLRPLALLRAELTRVRSGRADRIGGAQPIEIAPLVAELNTLLEENAASLERARRHVANLAHGLKTPLATLALALEKPGSDPDERLRPLVVTMDRRIRHHLARARAAALGGAERSRVLLATRVVDHTAVFRKLYADKALDFRIEIEPGIAVACEAQDLDEILGNLLDNAAKWARHRVLIAAIPSGPRIVLRIEDDGPGLSADEAADVMRPGRRLDESAPGHGFGLPITSELAELYGGAVTLEAAQLGGVAAVVSLPASP